MKNKQQKVPRIGMILEQREWMYHTELGEWLRTHPDATPTEIDQTYRRLAKKWRV